MKTKTLNKRLIWFALVSFTITTAQKKEEREAIKKMCGCFEVTFNFAETFHYSTDSLYQPSPVKQTDKVLEYGQLIKDEKGLISIQHLLQVGSPEHPHIVKHWRQDWSYQDPNLYMFNGDRKWTFTQKDKKEVKKQWTQKVYQVDDSPRYEGHGSWVNVDGITYWESTTPAPLPRREYTKRSDYNLTLRGNRHQITDYGWLHDQDNSKIIRKEGKTDFVLAKEKGYNTYVRVADEKCKAAQEWWKKHQTKWALVRTKWAKIYERNQNLKLHTKVEHKPLYKYLFDDENYDRKEKIDEIIEKFVVK